MKAEISPDIKERIFQIDQKIDEYKRYIKELEEEKLSLQMEENRRDDEKPVVLEKLETEPVSLNRTNSAKEKAEFLLDFFYSRRDIYAVRSKNKENKTTYYPKCHYFWSEVCKKRKLKEDGKKGGKKVCEDCEFKIYDELTADVVIQNNLKNNNKDGINAVGIYPIFNCDTVRFLAYDFDEKDWEKSSKVVVEVAKEFGFEAALERSFSGNGSHVWIFFKGNCSVMPRIT